MNVQGHIASTRKPRPWNQGLADKPQAFSSASPCQSGCSCLFVYFSIHLVTGSTSPNSLFPSTALSNSKGEFLLNGDFVVSMSKREVRVGSAVIEYSGSDNVVERLNCTDRIEEELLLQVNTGLVAIGFSSWHCRPADFFPISPPIAGVVRGKVV